MNADLVFKTCRREPFQPDGRDEVFVIQGFTGLMRQMPTLWRYGTFVKKLKLALKITAGRSAFFGIESSGRLVATGELALGYCRHYEVEPDAVVIGVIETDPARRGEGLATRSIKGAMNAMIARGRTTFYIDTQKSNLAMLRSIEKLGFGLPLKNR